MLARADCETNAEIARDALARFTRDHLSDWIPAFANKLESATTLPVLRQLASWLREMWTALIEYHEWETDPQPVLRSDPGREPEDVYECGAADLVQLEKSKAEDSKA